jgi:hypothetical protein
MMIIAIVSARKIKRIDMANNLPGERLRFSGEGGGACSKKRRSVAIFASL